MSKWIPWFMRYFCLVRERNVTLPGGFERDGQGLQGFKCHSSGARDLHPRVVPGEALGQTLMEADAAKPDNV